MPNLAALPMNSFAITNRIKQKSNDKKVYQYHEWLFLE
jgi:hypothetical protein